VLGQDRHQSKDQRQLAIAAVGEIETHGASIENFDLGDLGIVGTVVRPAVIAQQLPGEHHVFGGDQRTVGEMRCGIECKRYESAGVVGLDGLSEQSVKRKRFIVGARQQALDHVTADWLKRQTLHDQRIEAVERP